MKEMDKMSDEELKNYIDSLNRDELINSLIHYVQLYRDLNNYLASNYDDF